MDKMHSQLGVHRSAKKCKEVHRSAFYLQPKLQFSQLINESKQTGKSCPEVDYLNFPNLGEKLLLQDGIMRKSLF